MISVVGLVDCFVWVWVMWFAYAVLFVVIAVCDFIRFGFCLLVVCVGVVLLGL